VLVVEDNAVNAAVTEGMLAEIGCSSTLATSGRDAVTRALGERFDLILMDLHMPDLDGLEATRLIRRGTAEARVPIVAVTADAAETHRELCLAADMDGFIGKPVTLVELHRALAQWLREAAPAPARRDSAAGLDPEAIARIRALDPPGQAGLLERVVSLYVSGLAEQLRDLDAALARGDLGAARGIGHSLKSASANVGATEMARLAQRLERAGLEGDVAAARELATRLRDLEPAISAALQGMALRATA
jgi:CheY-like chemotaxis protein/HPt (histidine-containing phosphotransfer) domain-containing protein